MNPSPFLKWAGGKSQLLRDFDRMFPERFETYYEPFLGGGAVFFELIKMGKVSAAVLNDSNWDLMNLWAAIREDVAELTGHLDRLQKHVKDKSFFLSARKQFSKATISEDFLTNPNLEKAALLVYLNKTCYNGLYRVNRKGEFNVPFGRYRNPNLYSPENLLEINRVLRQRGITLLSVDFKEATLTARRDDFVYFDPPYEPINKTSSFTAYTSKGFGQADQARLSEVFKRLDKAGCKLLQSNSYRGAVLKPMYQRYFDEGFVSVVNASRAINSIGGKRGPVKELVITNYRPPQQVITPLLNS